jgi:selT/selW/selH-like putative selenoprotein
VLKERGHEASANEGEHSQFDVFADGELVFSKQQEGRFPEEDEVVRLLKP